MGRRSKSERQEEIGRIALRIIGTQGFHRLTTAVLSEQVGLAEGTIFRHFKNKDEIIRAASLELEKLLFHVAPLEDPNPLRRLRDFVLFRLQVLHEYPEVRAIVFNEHLVLSSTQEWGERVGSILSRSLHVVTSCLTDAQEQGLVAADVPVNMLVWMVTGTVRGASHSAPHQAVEPSSDISMSHKQIWAQLELLLRRTA